MRMAPRRRSRPALAQRPAPHAQSAFMVDRAGSPLGRAGGAPARCLAYNKKAGFDSGLLATFYTENSTKAYFRCRAADLRLSATHGPTTAFLHRQCLYHTRTPVPCMSPVVGTDTLAPRLTGRASRSGVQGPGASSDATSAACRVVVRIARPVAAPARLRPRTGYSAAVFVRPCAPNEDYRSAVIGSQPLLGKRTARGRLEVALKFAGPLPVSERNGGLDAPGAELRSVGDFASILPVVFGARDAEPAER